MKFTPTDEQWSKMQKHIKSDKYKKEDFFVFETRAVGDKIVPHRYTRLMPDFLKVMAEDAKKGVSLMLNHNWGQLGVQSIPVGKVFDSRIDGSSQEGETTSLYTTQYIHKDDSKVDGYSKNDIISLIETGVLADTSVGFTTDPSTSLCSICGNSIYDYHNCKHIPGKKYIVNEETNEVKQCIVELHRPRELSDEGNNVLMENSLVFDGAYPNAIIQSKLSNVSDKDENLQLLEGKQELSSGDVIIGYTSKNGVNLLYKHSNEKGGAKEMANTGEETEEVVEETVEETVENVDNSVDNSVDNAENVENTAENTAENAENTAENAENVSEDVHTEPETQSTETTEAMYSEASILEKFGNIADSFEGLIQLAKEGLENRNEVINEALESGVHSMGNSFNKEVFSKTFTNMSTKDIKEMGKAWEEQAKSEFSTKKISKTEVKNATSKEEKINYSKFKTGNY